MADDNLLMQIGIDVQVTNAAPTQATLKKVIENLNGLETAAEKLKAANALAGYFVSLQEGAKLSAAAIKRLATAFETVMGIRDTASAQINEQRKIQKEFDATIKSARSAASSLDLVARAREFQGMRGMEAKLRGDAAALRAFQSQLDAVQKSGGDPRTLAVPVSLGAQSKLKAEIRAIDAQAITDGEKRIAIYAAINRAIDQQATALRKLSNSAEVTAANRLSIALSHVRQEAKAAADEMSVLIDRSKRVKVDAGTAGGLVNSRLPFAPTVLGGLKQDAGTVAYFKLLQQRASAASSDLSNTAKASDGLATALDRLAQTRADNKILDEGRAAKNAAADFKAFREQIDAAVQAGQLLDFSKIAIPSFGSTGAEVAALRGRLATAGADAQLAAQKGFPNPSTNVTASGQQAAQLEEINKYLQQEGALIEQATRGTEAEVKATRQLTPAIDESTRARKLELDQMLYEKNLAAEQYAAMAARVRQTKSLNELVNRQAGNFYPLIIATGLWTGLSRAVDGFAAAAVKASTSQQSAFQSVARTANVSGNAALQVESIRQALLKLSTQTPTSFEDLSKIATAGNELGLTAEQIPKFTKLVVEYSTVTKTSIDDATKAFGGLAVVLDIPTAKLENFGAAVSLAGRKSAASEEEVLKMTSRIGSTAHQAGFAIPQIVGLGAALASVKEPAERSQGALEKYFSETGKAATEGGAKWKAFADIAGFSSTKLAKETYDADPYSFFRRFVAGLGQIREAAKAQGKDGFGITEAITAALNSTGLGADKRVKEVFQRLSGLGAQSELDKDVANASQGFAQGTDLATQYAKQVDNLQSQFIELQNAIANFLAAIGNAPIGALTGIVSGLKDIVTFAAGFAAANPKIAGAVFTLTLLVGVIAAYKAASFAAAIATYGLTAAQTRLGGASLVGNIGKLGALMLGLRTGTDRASASLVQMGIAAKNGAEGFTFTDETATKLGTTLERLQYIENGQGLAELQRQGAVAGSGLATASAEAQLLAERLYEAVPAIGSVSAALKVLTEAEVVSGDGAVIAEAGAVRMGAGFRIAAGGALMLTKSFFGFAILTYITDLLVDFRGTMMWTADAFKFIEPIIQAVDSVILGFGATVLKVASVLARVSSIFTGGFLDGGFTVADKLNEASDKLAGTYGHLGATLDSTQKSFKKWAAAQKGSDLGSSADFMKQAQEQADKWLKSQKAGGAGADDYKTKEAALKNEIADLKSQMPDATAAQDKHTAATKKAADAAAAAAKNFRTYADYAQELGGVLQRSFDIQFGPQQAHDAISSTFNEMRKQSADATKSIKDARLQIQGINADMAKLSADNIQQHYFLGIANAFGDRVGAAQIQANIAKNNADIADKQNSKKDQYKQIDEGFAQLDTATAGSSDAAIRNRDTLTGLVGKYQDYITKLAASGLSQKALTQKVNEARAEFIKQGLAMGYSRLQLVPYAKALEGFGEIVKKIPRNVTVTAKANTSAAALALDEFFKKKAVDAAAEAAQKMNQSLNTVGNGMNSALQKRIDALNKQLDDLHNKEKARHPIVMPGIRFGRNSGAYNAAIASDMGQISGLNAELKQALNNGRPERVLDSIIRRMKLASNQLEDHQRLSGRFSSGGYTGPGGKYEPAGIVHKGEYVVPKYMVNQQTGLPYADALGRLISGTRPQSGYAAGGYVNPDIMVVEPGPKFMRKLQEIVQTEVSAVIEPRAIAGANQDYTTQQRRRGSNQ